MDATIADLFSLQGKVALVTGARRGIGWEVARLLARAGAHVVLNDMVADGLAARVSDLEAMNLKASASLFDVTDHAAVKSAIDSIVAQHGGIDIVVNNAGNQNRKPFVDYSPEEWASIQQVHVTGTFNVTQAAARHMVAAKFGRVIMMSSLSVAASRSTLAAYATAKGAVTTLMRELAFELGPQGITCNAVAPGYLDTEFTSALVQDAEFSNWVKKRVPLGRWGRPEDIAPAILFLTSPAGSYVNGALLNIDGGILCGL
jgi:gluconate 5-dehydrogenase